MNPSRRDFLAAALAASQANAASPHAFSVFSKHLHFLGWPEMAAAAKEIGFDGIDLTVRKGGHVLPERVAEDLPKAKEAIDRAGLQLTMITSDVVDVSSPHAVPVLRTAAKLGVKHYRWGGASESKRIGGAESGIGLVCDVSHAFRGEPNWGVDVGSVAIVEGPRSGAGEL